MHPGRARVYNMVRRRLAPCKRLGRYMKVNTQASGGKLTLERRLVPKQDIDGSHECSSTGPTALYFWFSCQRRRHETAIASNKASGHRPH